MNLQDLARIQQDKEDLTEMIRYMNSAISGIRFLKSRYIVLKNISIGAKVYNKGDECLLDEDQANKIKSSVKKINDNFKEETLRKIKLYINFKHGIPFLKDVTISKCGNKIQIYECINRVKDPS